MATNMMDIAVSDTSADDVVAGGDFGVVESTREHQRQLILNNTGDFKQNPTICAGAFQYLQDENGIPDLIREITQQFMGDGMEVNQVALSSSGIINSDAYYP